ncbi:MAG: twin-arginine translocation signal domain-containing protein [Burkholderiales bacterium]
MNRREFLKRTGLSAAAATTLRAVSIVLDPDNPVARAAPVKWAAGELQSALAAQGVAVRLHDRIEQSAAGDFCIALDTSGP